MNDSWRRRFYAVGDEWAALAREQDGLATAGASSLSDTERARLHQLAQEVKDFAGGESA